MNGTSMVPRTHAQLAPEMGMTLQDLGKTMAASGFFEDAKDAAQCVVKIIAGRELGFGPVASMVGVYIVKGRVTLSANLIGSAIKRSGRYNFRVRRLDDQGCTLEFFEGRESIGISEFGLADAQKAGLAGSATYKSFPRNMFYARAMSNGAKWFTPDIFGGPIYTPEELGADVDGETGEVLSLPPMQTPAALEVGTLRPEPAPRGRGTADVARHGMDAEVRPAALAGSPLIVTRKYEELPPKASRLERLGARYITLLQEARELEIDAIPLPENADESTLTDLGVSLKEQIEEARKARAAG